MLNLFIFQQILHFSLCHALLEHFHGKNERSEPLFGKLINLSPLQLGLVAFLIFATVFCDFKDGLIGTLSEYIEPIVIEWVLYHNSHLLSFRSERNNFDNWKDYILARSLIEESHLKLVALDKLVKRPNLR